MVYAGVMQQYAKTASRQMYVLRAIAAEPGLNSREVGERSGVADRGQLSRLLTRLAQLGLVHGERPRPGAGYSWEPTARGWHAVRSTDQRKCAPDQSTDEDTASGDHARFDTQAKS